MRISLYSLALHVTIVILIAAFAWQFIAAQRKIARESELVIKYRPAMQRICDDLGVKIQIDDFEDLLNAYERITMQTTDSLQ